MYDIAKQGVPVIAPIDQAAAVRAILVDSKVSKGLYKRLGVEISGLKKTITQEISRGIATGLGSNDIARNLANASKAPLNRTRIITRTEGHRIQQTSTADAQQAAKDNGADVVKQWDATLDGNTRDSHRRVDGETRELEEKFSNGLMRPGDPDGDASEVINCRCACLTRARWALDESELKTLQDRAKFFGLDKAENFEDFKAKYLNASGQITNAEATRPARNKADKTFKKTLESFENNGTITLPDIDIGRSIGAKAKNYDVIDPASGEYFHFVEGTRIQNAEVFAGYGVKTPLREEVSEGLTNEFGGAPSKWQHAKGTGVLDYYGDETKAEVHWFQEETVGKVKFKVKRWLE